MRHWFINKWNPEWDSELLSTEYLSKKNCQLDIENKLLNDIETYDGVSRMSEVYNTSLEDLESFKDSFGTSRHFIVSTCGGMSLYKVCVEYDTVINHVLENVPETESYEEEYTIMVDTPVLQKNWFSQTTKIEQVPEVRTRTVYRTVLVEKSVSKRDVVKTARVEHLYTLSPIFRNHFDNVQDTRDCKEAVAWFIEHLDVVKFRAAFESGRFKSNPDLVGPRTGEKYTPSPSNNNSYSYDQNTRFTIRDPSNAHFNNAPPKLNQLVPKPVQLAGLGMLNNDIMARYDEMFGNKQQNQVSIHDSPNHENEDEPDPNDWSDNDQWDSELCDSNTTDDEENAYQLIPDFPEFSDFPELPDDYTKESLSNLLIKLETDRKTSNPFLRHLNLQKNYDKTLPRYELHPRYHVENRRNKTNND